MTATVVGESHDSCSRWQERCRRLWLAGARTVTGVGGSDASTILRPPPQLLRPHHRPLEPFPHLFSHLPMDSVQPSHAPSMIRLRAILPFPRDDLVLQDWLQHRLQCNEMGLQEQSDLICGVDQVVEVGGGHVVGEDAVDLHDPHVGCGS